MQFEIADCFKPITSRADQFDFATTHSLTYHVADEKQLEILFQNAYNMLKRGGKFFLGQTPGAVITPSDQETLADLCGSHIPLKSACQNVEPFPDDGCAYYPAPATKSSTGRPFTRDVMFTWSPNYRWSKEKLMATLQKVGFRNVELLPALFPDEVLESERKRLEALQEPFTLIGAEKR